MVLSKVLTYLTNLLIGCSMTREEAIAIAHSDPEIIVEILLKLSARIEELERKVAQLTKDSSNSSKSPSSDGPAPKPKPRRRKNSRKRRPGGQPGHKGHNRELIPLEEVDVLHDIVPETCEKCHSPLQPGTDHTELLGSYLRHQVVDIPPVKPHVTEYRLRQIKCGCGAITCGDLPPDARSGFGARITALLVYLTACHRVTRRGCQEIARTLLDIEISLGSVCKLHQEVSQSLEASYEEVREALSDQKVLNVDETGWRSMGKRMWLWIFVASRMALFTISGSRGSKVLKGVLGEVFGGILCSDRFSAYNAYHKGIRQVCLAHIIRDLKGLKHACRSPDAVKFSRWMLREIGRLFGVWHAFRDEQLDRRTLVQKSVPIRARIHKCLQTHQGSTDREVRTAAKGLLKCWQHLFIFLEYDGVEPTNNSAERGIRPAVQWRKICFGNRSEKGELLTARLLTATRTCILQQTNPFEFIVDSINAYRKGLTAPSLLSDPR